MRESKLGSPSVEGSVVTAYSVGDRVRFTTFGEWRSGTISQVGRPMQTVVCIVPDGSSGCVWRWPGVHALTPEGSSEPDAPSSAFSGAGGDNDGE